MFKKIIAVVRRKLSKVSDRSRSKVLSKGGGVKDAEKVEGKVESVIDVGISESSVKKKRPHRPAKREYKEKKVWSLDQFEVPPEEGKKRFHDFDLPLKLMRAIAELKFQYCTPIQAKAFPETLSGKDLIGQANTGTGKSAVFLITIISKLLSEGNARKKNGVARSLIIAPTRELVTQIAKDGKKLAKFTGLRVIAVYGGVDYQRQMELLKNGRCDIVVATPGRLLDFMQKRVVSLEEVSTFVLDEADRMLDMGFIPDVRKIVYKMVGKDKRHTMLFSATISPDVKRLAESWCKNPVTVEVEPENVAVDSVEQLTYMVTEEEKYTVLYNLIKKNPKYKMIVFANQKNEAKRLADRLSRNKVHCSLLTGDVAQNKREKRLEDFRSGRVKILVATDVAGRGIHISGIEYVVNYTLPYEPEDYVHRIGRTGRAGKTGVSISFACEKGSFYLPEIEEYIGRKLPCTVPDEDLFEEPPKRAPQRKKHTKSGGYKKKRYPNSKK